MTVLEKRAREFCRHVEQSDREVTIRIEWKKSRMWGSCPRIEWCGDLVTRASGCGYDKESAVLAELLLHLVPDVAKCSGAGVDSVIRCMGDNGWDLKKVYSGISEDGYEIRRSR